MNGLPEVNWNKSQPNDARRVHGEPDVFRLVKGGRDFSRHHGVNGT